MIAYYLSFAILTYLYLTIFIIFAGSFIKDRKFKSYSPKASIVIAAWNEEKLIEKCLNSILAQQYGNDFEVIIVGGGSDQTPDIISKFKDVKFIREEKPNGKWNALNTAITSAKYDTIAAIDADAVAPIEWLKRIVAPLERYDLSLSSYINYNNKDTIVSRAYYTFSTLFLNLETFMGRFFNTAYANGANMAFKKKVWEKSKFKNYLLEDFAFCSDAIKNGFKKTFVSSAVVRVQGPLDYKNFSAQTGRFFRGLSQLLFTKGRSYDRFLYSQYILFFLAVPIIFFSFAYLYINSAEQFNVIFSKTWNVAWWVVFASFISTKSVSETINTIASIPVIMLMSTAMFMEQIYLILRGRFKEWTRMERV